MTSCYIARRIDGEGHHGLERMIPLLERDDDPEEISAETVRHWIAKALERRTVEPVLPFGD
jgi:hypothetical protein